MRAYWVSAFAADYATSLLVAAAVVVLLQGFQVSGLAGNKILFMAAELLMLPLANIPFAYVLSFAISDPDSSRSLLVVSNFVLGMIPFIANIVLNALKYYTWAKVVNYTFGLFPAYALLICTNLTLLPDDIDVADMFGMNDIYLYGGALGPFSAPALSLVFLASGFVLYSGLVWAIEAGLFARLCRGGFGNNVLVLPAQPHLVPAPVAKDEDVQNEERRVLESIGNGESTGDAIVMKQLRKVYPPRGLMGSIVAVDRLSLAVCVLLLCE
eukprot:gnl/Hemi2/13752_TR4679_c0_g3_i1.p1 gnl/Hemi2/13752_TR4679_c0_g3~~gnl/Hemi2/13752_TR4679_c0_g3_i1.p1  ORF type:complete len:269 (-),score=89.09 gnl/Hemi2/13752_TR4679_c0_g3_i1:39-845(-)